MGAGYVAMSNGDGSFAPVVNSWWNDANYMPDFKRTVFLDVDGDGWMDVCSARIRTVENMPGTVWGLTCEHGDGDGTFDESVPLSIIDQNGIESPWFMRPLELFASKTGGPQDSICTSYLDNTGWHTQCQRVINELPLLTKEENGMGATISIGYRRHSVSNIPALGRYDVTSTSINDGRGNVSTRTISYGQSFFDRSDRSFLGYNRVEVTLPCSAGLNDHCGTLIATFHTSEPLAGKIKNIGIYQNKNIEAIAPKLQMNNLYASPCLAGDCLPYIAHQIMQTVITNDPEQLNTTRFWLRTVTFNYDDISTDNNTWIPGFGNVTRKCDYGDYNDNNDDVCTYYEYHSNVDAYIVNKPARVSMQQAGLNSALISDTFYYYDSARDSVENTGQTSWQTVPTRGLVTERRDWLDTDGHYITHQYEYDDYGNLVAIIGPPTAAAPLGARSETFFDPIYHQIPIAIHDPLYNQGDTRHSITIDTFDPACWQPTQTTDMNGVWVKQQYDVLCRPTVTQRSVHNINSEATIIIERTNNYVGYDNDDCLRSPVCRYVEVQQPGPAGEFVITTQAYTDGLGRPWLISASGPRNDTYILQRTEYDARGNISFATMPYYKGETPQWLTRSYDFLGRLIKLEQPDGTAKSLRYGIYQSAVGDEQLPAYWLAVYSTDELGHEQMDAYDPRGKRRLHREKSDYGENAPWYEISFDYDLFGRMQRVNDPYKEVASWVYDSLGRLRSMRHVDQEYRQSTFTYDDAGHLLTSSDPMQQITTYNYDVLGRQLSRTLWSGEPNIDVCEWRYDEGSYSVGRITSDVCYGSYIYGYPNETSREYYYDSKGNLTNENWSIREQKYVFSWLYDTTGNYLLGRGFPNGEYIGDNPTTSSAEPPLEYDSSGRLHQIPGVVDNIAYTAWGAIASYYSGDNTRTDFVYHPKRNSLNSITKQSQNNGVTIFAQEYLRDSQGKVTQVISPTCNEGWSYSYDYMNRLRAALNHYDFSKNERYDFDELGNPTFMSNVGNILYNQDNHQLSYAGANTYVYNRNGSTWDKNGRAFMRDGAEKLFAIADPQYIYTQYTYAADDERFRRVELDEYGSNQETLSLGGDYEINISTGEATAYVALAGKLLAKSVAKTWYWLATDRLGSVIAVTDINGQQILRRAYSPFGRVIQKQGNHRESHGYVGQVSDSSGLIYLHGRFYDPEIGRMLSLDPLISLSGLVGLNGYAYANNDPINWLDPTGFAAESSGDGGGTGGDIGGDSGGGDGGGYDWSIDYNTDVYTGPNGGWATDYSGYQDGLGECNSYGCNNTWVIEMSPNGPSVADMRTARLAGTLMGLVTVSSIGILGQPSLNDLPSNFEANQLKAAFQFAYDITVAGGMWAAMAAGGVAEVGVRGNVVIGKVSDLTKPGAIKAGERTLLSELPDRGYPKANWKQNSGVLRHEMAKGIPIRDATIDSMGMPIKNNGFLRAERYLLDTHGWVYNTNSTMWHPPLSP